MNVFQWFSNSEGFFQGALIATLMASSVQVALRAGVLSFASVGFYGIGAYGAGFLLTKGAWPILPVVLVILAGATIVAFLLALVLARLRALYLAMATLAFVLLVHSASLALDEITGGPLGLYGIPTELGTISVAFIGALVIAINALTQRGESGRKLLLLRQDEALAGALGVDVRRTRRAAFVWSSVLGTLAGVCQANLLTVFTPENFGFGLIVSTLTALVIGGTWHWAGPIIGGLVLAWLPQWLAFAGEWREVAEGIITIVVLIFLPAGIGGVIDRVLRGTRRQTGNLDISLTPVMEVTH